MTGVPSMRATNYTPPVSSPAGAKYVMSEAISISHVTPDIYSFLFGAPMLR